LRVRGRRINENVAEAHGEWLWGQILILDFGEHRGSGLPIRQEEQVEGTTRNPKVPPTAPPHSLPEFLLFYLIISKTKLLRRNIMFPHAVKPFSKRAKCLMYHFFYYPFVIGQQMKANYFYINFLPI